MTATRTRNNQLLLTPWIAAVAVMAFALGAITTAVAPSLIQALPAQERPVGAVPTFDAVTFRAEERAGSYPEPTFDAVTFRAEEAGRGAAPEPTFDAVKFRAEEAGR